MSIISTIHFVHLAEINTDSIAKSQVLTMNCLAAVRSSAVSGVIRMVSTKGSRRQAAEGIGSKCSLEGLRSMSKRVLRDWSNERERLVTFVDTDRSIRTGITFERAKLSVCIVFVWSVKVGEDCRDL